MLKKLLFLTMVTCGMSACTSTYFDSAQSQDGGRFVVGAYNGKSAVFHCDTSTNAKCKHIKVKFK